MSPGDGSATQVVIGTDAVQRLVEYSAAAEWPQALLVMDPNTREAAGAEVAASLRSSGLAVREFVFPQRQGLPAGLTEAGEVGAALKSEQALVAVGSGVITDICRYAAHQRERDFVSVPTAASMDGYASGMAAMELDGVKVTYPARAPTAIFADPRVAAGAPAELTRAGLGDLLAKATAQVDWLAAHLLYEEPFSAEVEARVLEPLSFAAGHVEAVLAGGTEAIGALLRGLVQSGIAMALAGSSRPASGSEHHASHFWDLLAARGRREHAAHGLQVGYATRFAIRLQRFAFGGGVTELRRPVAPPDPLGPGAREWLGEPSAEVVAAVAEKTRFSEAVPAGWPSDRPGWDRVRAELAPALSQFDAVERALEQAGIPDRPGYLGIDAALLRATFRFAGRLRARYTVIDFLEGQGALDAALEAMLAPSPPLRPRWPRAGPDR